MAAIHMGVSLPMAQISLDTVYSSILGDTVDQVLSLLLPLSLKSFRILCKELLWPLRISSTLLDLPTTRKFPSLRQKIKMQQSFYHLWPRSHLDLQFFRSSDHHSDLLQVLQQL